MNLVNLGVPCEKEMAATVFRNENGKLGLICACRCTLHTVTNLRVHAGIEFFTHALIYISFIKVHKKKKERKNKELHDVPCENKDHLYCIILHGFLRWCYA